jgi:hypothetical protein
MKLDKSLEPFRAAIESLQRLLHKFDERGVIIGGIAVGFLGKPRFTADIDAVFLIVYLQELIWGHGLAAGTMAISAM